MTNHCSMSCGVYQVYSLERVNGRTTGSIRSKKRLAEHFIEDVQANLETDRLAFLAFSDYIRADGRKRPGQKIAEALEYVYPGSITATPARTNRNSGNDIIVWLFAVPPGTFQEERYNGDDEWA